MTELHSDPNSDEESVVRCYQNDKYCLHLLFVYVVCWLVSIDGTVLAVLLMLTLTLCSDKLLYSGSFRFL